MKSATEACRLVKGLAFVTVQKETSDGAEGAGWT
jgi:hypothetical protein